MESPVFDRHALLAWMFFTIVKRRVYIKKKRAKELASQLDREQWLAKKLANWREQDSEACSDHSTVLLEEDFKTSATLEEDQRGHW